MLAPMDPETLPTCEAIDAEFARRSLRTYLEWIWPIVEPSTPFIPGWHLSAICEHLEAVTRREIRHLLITVPPRHTKSLICSVAWPTWAWATNPALRFLFASYAADLSTEHAVLSRRVIESARYQSAFGHRVVLTTDQNIKTFYENTARGYRISTSVGGAATGRGGDATIIDDPHSLKEIHSEPIRSEVLRWHDQVWSTRLNDPEHGGRVVIMQRGHEQDLGAHLLARGGYVHLSLPSEYEPTTFVSQIGWKDPRKKPGELLCPARVGPGAIAEAKRDLGSYGFAAQHQQRPSPAEGGLIKRHWWKFYTTRPAQFDEMLQSWDMAFKATSDTDYVVGQPWGRIGADCYLLDQTRDRMTFSSTLKAVRALTAKWPAAWTKLVEDTANGPAVIDTLSREIPGLIAVKPDGGKIARLQAVSPMIEAGNVWLPHPDLAPWVHDFIEEVSVFPNGANDDQCFVAGTPIATLFGDKPIEAVRVGDRVITPFGVRRVLAAGLTGHAHTIRRGPLVGTPGHPVFCDGQFVKMDALTQASVCDRLSVGGMLKWAYKRLLCSMELGIDSWGGRKSIISVSQQQIAGGETLKDFMSRCTNTIAGRKYRQSMRFIIRTAILSITTLAIWSVYRCSNIVSCIGSETRRSREDIFNAFGLKQQHGTGLQRAMRGTRNTARGYLQIFRSKLFNVSTVVRQLLLGGQPGLYTAVQCAGTNVEPHRASITSLSAALSVVPRSTRFFQSTQAESPTRVADHAGEDSPINVEAVYNITVEKDHVYYAHGLLVSNCDAMSQALRRLFAMADLGITLGSVERPEQPERYQHLQELHNGVSVDDHASAGCLRCHARLAEVR